MLKFKRIALGLAVVVVLMVGLVMYARGSNVPATSAAEECQTFQETGKTVCGKFLQYWKSHGGLAQQGFPISDVFEEKNADPPAGDGKVHKVQYFERARFEEHLENSPPNDVLLGLLGSEQFNAKYVTKPGAQLLTVKGKRTETKIGTSSPKQGFVFVVVDVSLTNTTTKELSSNPLYFTIKSDQGYDYDTTVAGYTLPRALKLTKLQPGETANGELAFEVPSGETPKSITFSNFDTKVTVNL